MVVSLSERRVYIKFWNWLTPSQRKQLNRVSEDMPLDRAGGLMTVTEDLWRNGLGRIANFVLLILRIALNLGAVFHAATSGLGTGQVTAHESGQGSQTILTPHKAKICDTNIEVHGHVGRQCIELTLARYWAYRVCSWGEVTVVGSAAFFVFCSYVWFYLMDKGLPERRPCFFFLMPRFASTFSAMYFLQFVNLARLYSFIVRGEGMFMLIFLGDSLRCSRCCRRMKEVKEFEDGGVDDDRPILTNIRIVLVGLIFIGLVIGSFQALLVKLTIIHFASMKSFYVWTRVEWLLCAGFVNQIAGLTQSIEIELQRVLLLKFGGSGCQWTYNLCVICLEYFRLLAVRIVVSPKFNESRSRSLAAMALLDSNDIQRLLISKEREKIMKDGRKQRLKLNEEVFVTEGVQFAEQLDELVKHSLKETQKKGRFFNTLEKAELMNIVSSEEKDAYIRDKAVRRLQANWRASRDRGKLKREKESFGAMRMKQIRKEEVVNEGVTKAMRKESNASFSVHGMVMLARAVQSRIVYLRKRRDEFLRKETEGHYASNLIFASQLQEHIDDLEENTRTGFSNDFQEFKVFKSRSCFEKISACVSCECDDGYAQLHPAPEGNQLAEDIETADPFAELLRNGTFESEEGEMHGTASQFVA